MTKNNQIIAKKNNLKVFILLIKHNNNLLLPKGIKNP